MTDALTMKEYLNVLREKLATIRYLLKKQIKKFKEIRKENPSAGHEDLLIAQQKSIITSIEMLQGEIDEFVNISIFLYTKARNNLEEKIIGSNR